MNDTKIPRRICIGMITRTRFIRAVKPWREHLKALLPELARQVAARCFDYYDKYNRAPKTEIEPYFDDLRSTLGDDSAEQMEMLLQSLSDEYEIQEKGGGINSDHLIDQTGKYLKRRHAEVRDDEVTRLRGRGEYDEADALRASYRPLDLTGPESELVWATDVKSKVIDWLWKNRIPRAETTMLLGDPGLGKSTVAVDIAARVSRGDEWPIPGEGRAPRGGVMIITAEDKWEHTVKPRLQAAGADMKYIAFLPAMVTARNPRTGERTYRPWSVRDEDRICRELEVMKKRGRECMLLILDPLAAFMGGKDFDSHRNTDVRSTLMPFEERVVSAHRLALLTIDHPNKSQQRAIYRASGSVAFTAMPRSAFVVGTMNDEDDDPDRRLIARLKHNITKDRTGMAYRIDSVTVRLDDGEEEDLPVIVWEREPIDITADDLLAPDNKERAAKLAAAKEWLQVSFAAHEKQDAKDVIAAAKKDGINYHTLNNARNALGIVTSGGRGAVWTVPSRPSINTFLRTPRTLQEIGKWAIKNTVLSPRTVQRFVRDQAQQGAIRRERNDAGPARYSIPDKSDKGERSRTGKVVEMDPRRRVKRRKV